MTFFSNISIRRKLTLIAMQTSIVSLLLSAAGFIAYELHTFRAAMVQDLTSEADLIGAQSLAALRFDSPDEAEKNLSALRVRQHITAACIYRDGKVFARFRRNAGRANPWPDHPGPEGAYFQNGALNLIRPITLMQQTVGAIYLQSDLAELDERLNRYAGIGAIVMIVSFLVSLFLSSKLQRTISEPLSRLANTARSVSTGKNYSIRAVKDGEDEVGQLIDGFNEMLGQIQEGNAELEKARNQLELRVEERTYELQLEIKERLRAEQDLQQQITRISLLNQITYAVAARQDLDSIVLVVLQQLEERLPIDYGTAYRYDSQSQELVAMVRGPKSRAIAEALRTPDTLPAAATAFQPCLTGEMVYVPDNAQRDLPIAQRMAQAGIRSVVGAPLVIDSKIFGILVFGRKQVNGFSDPEREFIRGLSAHVALAIHQAQLYQDLHKAYNDLRQTQQTVMQQQRLRALGQMASGIAHDINNALSPVVAYSELLQQMEPRLSPNGKKVLGHIRTAGEDIAHIVSRMREFYRPRDASEQFVALNLNALATEVVELTRPRWRDIPQSRGVVVGIKTELAEGLPPVIGDASELREALTNLILNAVDALPKGGAILVRTRLAAWTGKPQLNRDAYAVLEVIDDGIGMDEETRRRCLEPFFSTKGQRGTGMGLAMVYGIMERHDGAIEIQSQPGAGTTMRLIFPVRQGAPMEENATSSAGRPRFSLRLLCIDDEPQLRELMREILEADGHRVSVADGGQSGVDAFLSAKRRNEPFDVVITDLGMPHLNGRQVAQIVKRESPTTPVIMLTGWGTLMKANGDVPAQVDGVLSKPPRISEIRERLNRCAASI